MVNFPLRVMVMVIDEKTAEEQWDAHRAKCSGCRRYETDKPATLAHVCVMGAPLIKSVLERDARPAIRERRRAERQTYKYQMEAHGAQHVSKEKLKRLTRYK
jgi:hypothetical protein